MLLSLRDFTNVKVIILKYSLHQRKTLGPYHSPKLSPFIRFITCKADHFGKKKSMLYFLESQSGIVVINDTSHLFDHCV